MRRHLSGWTAGVCLVFVLAIAASVGRGEDAKAPATQPAKTPNPQLQPLDVAKIVVAALSQNDDSDTGIKTTWEFASPQNKQMTGPVERFIPMVKTPAYQPMLNSRSAQFHEVGIKDNRAEELVGVISASGEKAYYVFQLSKQLDGPFKDCWMTDAVVRVKPKEPGDAPASPPDDPLAGQSPV